MFKEKYVYLLSVIGDHKTMVLSTAVGDTVDSRMMSIVQFNEKFYFQTDCKMNKYRQMKLNPNFSLCFDNISIQGKCREIGIPAENKTFCNLYSKYFSRAYQLYSHLENEVLFEITPTLIKVWDYEDGSAYYEIYNVWDKSYVKKEYK